MTFRAGDGDGIGVEQDHIREGAHVQPPAVDDAVNVGWIAGQLTDRRWQIHRAQFADPAAVEVHGIACVAQQGVVRPGIGQADKRAVIAQNLADLVLLDIENAAGEDGFQVFLHSEIEEHVDGIAHLCHGDIGDAPPIQRGVLRQYGRGHIHQMPVAVENAARIRPGQRVTDGLAKPGIGENRPQFLMRALGRPGRDRLQDIGRIQREAQTQRLARRLSIHGYAACAGRVAGRQNAGRTAGIVGVLYQRRVDGRPSADRR